MPRQLSPPRRVAQPVSALASFGLVSFCLLAECLPSRADDLPIMYTYEVKKQRSAERAVARDPKRFWVRQIFNRIEDKSAALPKALKAAVTVRLSFAVARDGHLLSKTIAAPSGDDTADKAAVAMLERAAPFPPMPAAMTDQEMSFELPVRFR